MSATVVIPDVPLAQEKLGKRVLDFTVSAVALVALAPLLLLLAVLVKWSSPGPVFFRQQRVGRGGVSFSVYKFRSMRVHNSGPSVTAGTDARITPVGKRLRAWKLDELPQLFNVLRGEMSLVGPRPEVPAYVRHYTPEQLRVLSVRPGITGISQLQFREEEALLAGKENVEAFYLSKVLPVKLALDLTYVDQQSLMLDLKILGQTALALFIRRRTQEAHSPQLS